ncbi:hypothetical protein ACLVWU_12350 [Bdellovibrio sp. HCB290]|uniref:hypothetical protein n=1 Tax=Bdellovibrio sp. HCB290 TaxID=3394356 RepID=UPI0039B542FA
MRKIICTLLVMILPLGAFADNSTDSKSLEAYLAYTKEVAQVDSYIRQEVEALAVKSALSANHPDRLTHQQNIQKASEYKAVLARQNSLISCQHIFK